MFRAHALVLALLACMAVLCQGRNRDKRDIMFPGYNEPPYPHHHHHGHHHRPSPTRRPSYQGTTPPSRDTSLAKAIPDELLEQLNEIGSIDEYLKRVRTNVSVFGDPSLQVLGNRIGVEDDIEKKSVGNPTFAKCMPEETTITVEIDDPNPSYIYMPLCIRVKRCGGCCLNSMHACIPTETELVTYKVTGSQYRGYGNSISDMDLKEVKLKQVEVHKACKCGCKIKRESCIPGIQTFKPSSCACVCSNKDEQKKCLNQDLMQWDSKRCACLCREVKECSTGSLFNPRSCRCEVDRRRSTESRLRRGDDTLTTKTKVQSSNQDN